MALSKREKNLLTVLLVIGIFSLLYRFVYLPKLEQIEELDESISNGKNFYEEIDESVKNDDKFVEVLKAMKLKSSEIDRLLPVQIYQEEIMLYLERALEEFNIEATNISFSVGELSDGSDKAAVKGATIENLLTEYEKSGQLVGPQIQSDSGDNSGEMGLEIKQFDVDISLSGTYNNLKSFMASIESNKRLIGIHGLEMFAGDSENGMDEIIQGGVTLSFPFYEDGKINELFWDVASAYGKQDLFADEPEYSSIYNYKPDMKEFNRSDFYIFLDADRDDFPTVTFGKTPYNYTAIYSNSKEAEELRIQIKKEQSEYFYRLENKTSAFPFKSDEYESFTPSDEGIYINVYPRQDDVQAEIPGAFLVIENGTEIPVIINVLGSNEYFGYEAKAGQVRIIAGQ